MRKTLKTLGARLYSLSKKGELTLNDNHINKTNQIRDVIKEVLSQQGAVKKLNLQSQGLDFKAAEILAEFIATDTFLDSLYLSDNNIGDKGAEAISQGLRENKTLKIINLSNNSIGHSGAKNIAQMLYTNTAIQTIYLTDNKTSYGCNSEFIEVIKQNTSLRYAALGFDNYDTKLDGRIKDALLENARLEEISATNHIHIRNHNPQLLNNAIRDYSVISSARMIRKINTQYPAHNFYDTIADIEELAFQETDRILMDGLRNAEIIAFFRHWYSPFHQTTSQKIRDYGGVKWPPLFGKKEIEIPAFVTDESGWKLFTLTSAAELISEGQNLKHCVGGYTRKCIMGDSHIVSVVNSKGEAVSTIEFALRHDGSLKQQTHSGVDDSSPSLQSTKVANWISEEVKSGNIKIDLADIEIARSQMATKIMSSPFQANMGFNPLDDSKFLELIRVYTKQMLPSGKLEIDRLTKNFTQDFLGERKITFAPDTRLRDLGNIGEITLDSIRQKPETKFENKIKSSIKNSTNKIFGENIIDVSITNNEVFFSAKSSKDLAKIKKIFEGKFEEKNNELSIKVDRHPQSVREIMIQARREKRKESHDDLKIKPRSAVQNPTTKDTSNDLHR